MLRGVQHAVLVERTADAGHDGINTGLRKWPVDPDRCFSFWVRKRGHCSVCVRVCPFNKPDTWFHNAVRWQISRLPLLNRLSNWADEVCGYGKQVLGDPDDEYF